MSSGLLSSPKKHNVFVLVYSLVFVKAKHTQTIFKPLGKE